MVGSFHECTQLYERDESSALATRVIRDAGIPHPAIRVGVVSIRVTVGLCFTTRRPVTLLKLINGARHVLGIQHGNQSGQRLFSIPRSSIAETLVFIVIVMALIAATAMWGYSAGGCGYSGKGRRRHTDTTMHPYLSWCRTRWGRLRQRGRVAGRRPLPGVRARLLA